MKKNQFLTHARNLLLPLAILLLAACTSTTPPTPGPIDDDDNSSRSGKYDLTTSEGIQQAYESLTRNRVEADDYCFIDVDSFADVAIIGTFANDYGCMFSEVIVVDEVGSFEEMTPLALQHNGWDDPTNRELLAQEWAEEALLYEFSIMRSENDDFLQADSPPFTPPTVVQMENGRIHFDTWIREPSGMLPQNTYRHMHIVYSEQGNLITFERGLQFSVEFNIDIEPTLEPTATEEPVTEVVPTATAVPASIGLQQEMPWIVMANFNGIFAANGDGSGIAQLSDDLIAYGQNSLLAAISPDGQWLAYVNASSETEPVLMVMELRSQTVRAVTPLTSEISIPADAPLDCLGEGHASDPCQALYTVGPMAWSPDGSQLAFIGAHDGPTSDLYVYDLVEDQVRQLTDGSAHAANPVWSPNGEYIFHQGIFFNFGSGVATVTAAWSARADGGGVVTLHGDPDSTWETILGWQGDETIIVHSEAWPCAKNLRAINVATGVTTSLWDIPFGADYVAYSDTTETILISDGSVAGCGSTQEEQGGLFFISAADGRVTELTSIEPWEVSPLHWEPSLEAFYFETLDSWQLIFPNDLDEINEPADVTLPDGVRLSGGYSWGIYAWFDSAAETEGVYAYDRNNPNVGVQLIAPIEARNVHLPADTTTILFFSAESPTTLYVAEGEAFEPVAVTNGELRGRHWDTAVFWSPPLK